MYYSERQSQILALLQTEKALSVHRLATRLSISESSIRRDLSALEELGKIKRTYGGAVLVEAPEREVSLLYRSSQRIPEKMEIARKAAKYIKDGMLIFLDASSSAAQLIPYLENFKDLTVVTNSPATSMKLGELKIRNYCTGGLLLRHSIAYVGSGAEDFLNRFTADIVFFSCRGLSADGILSDSMEEEVQIRRIMLKNAKKKVLLCDRSKYGQEYPYRLCKLSEVDAVISETNQNAILTL